MLKKKKKNVYFSFFLGRGGGGRVAGCRGSRGGGYFNKESTSVTKNWGRGVGWVTGQLVFQMAFLFFKENNCAKFF